MNIASIATHLAPSTPTPPAAQAAASDDTLREAFHDFVGQTFFGQMIAAMRKTVDKPAYFHGGRAEEVFQGQMDQLLAEEMTDATADQFSEPMFRLSGLSRW
jgi:peptidoglycan hydrolase FlgJ